MDLFGTVVYGGAMETKLFLSDRVEAIHSFEMKNLSADLNEIQREMASWEKPWRKESLEHYSTLGWSFLAEEDGEVLGYVLGQPILFFNNWTQTLWIEHLGFKTPEVGHELVDVAIRWARTKHLQKVIINSASDKSSFVMESFKGFKEGSFLHLSTTKLSED